MKKTKPIYLDFIVDKLTNSIQNAISGDSFQTDICRLTMADLKLITKKNGWKFKWKEELANNSREVYKLTIINNPTIIQGLLSFTIKTDHIYMNLLESAPFNLGRNKIYEGIPGNLVAYACKVSFQNGFEGFVSFDSKTNLTEHYKKSLGANHFGGQLMIIPTPISQNLVDKYFKN